MDRTEDRYARQRLIPRWDQARIAAATAVVIGVGALGNEVAKNLALLGLGRLILCDPDTVALSNLNRTVLFDAASVGRPKAAAAASALARLAPEMTVEPRQADLVRGAGLGELASADIVLGCLDSRHARLQLLGRCALAGARLIDGGTDPWGGELRIRLDPEDACYGCTLTAAGRGESDVPAGCDPGWGTGRLPASIMTTALVASWMTTTAVRIVLGEPPPWRFLAIDTATALTQPVVSRRDPACPYHQPIGPVQCSGLSLSSTVEALCATLPADAEPLAWAPFPLAGTCHFCREKYSFGYAHRESTAVCAHCGRRLRLRFTQRIRAAAPGTPLHDLGIAPEEILAVRIRERSYQWLRLSRGDRRAVAATRSGQPRISS